MSYDVTGGWYVVDAATAADAHEGRSLGRDKTSVCNEWAASRFITYLRQVGEPHGHSYLAR